MRLLLDEHLSPEIARQLRERGHDVASVSEQVGLRTRSDRVVFAAGPDQRRAIVTRDVGDFRPLLARALRTSSPTYGLVCLPRRFPSSRGGIGRLVDALEALLESNPADDDLVRRGGEVWLDDPQ